MVTERKTIVVERKTFDFVEEYAGNVHILKITERWKGFF